MSGLDDMKAALDKKLDERRASHVERTEQEAADYRAVLMNEIKIPLPSDLSRRVDALGSNWAKTESVLPRVPGLVDISGSNRLKEMDDAFSQLFGLRAYYQTDRLAYPTVYTETLEEFFSPMFESLDASRSTHEVVLQQEIKEAKELAEKSNGDSGTFGYCVPGRGAFLNGWLVSFNQNITPRQAFSNPQLANEIYKIAIHEKLGHGFLAEYSALGQIKSRLGLDSIELANRFGLRTADDPASTLRIVQSNLIFSASRLLEEGYATWLESFMGTHVLRDGVHPKHKIQPTIEAIHNLPENIPDHTKWINILLASLDAILGEDEVEPRIILEATKYLEMFGDLSQKPMTQPLCYAAGELIMMQAERNLGPLCVPYAALIAANITFDLTSVGVTDLQMLINSDPRLNPDARLAAISRLKLKEKNNIHELASLVSEKLNFSCPAEIK